MSDKHIDFSVDYKKLRIFEEFNTKEIKFPIVLSIPHSGRIFPEEFLKNVAVNTKELRGSEDCFVDEIFGEAKNHGITGISMNIARAFVDLNRDKIELDPTMFFDYPEVSSEQCGRRCRIGYGVIHRITDDNKPIYDGLISFDEVNERIEKVYDVYHKRLKQLIDKTVKTFGFCFVLDCHSMPSRICSRMLDDKKIDVCLGNLFDQSCPKEIIDFIRKNLEEFGYNVEMNIPFSGAFITFNYCQPRKKIFTLQLEINRGLYTNEENLSKLPEIQSISENMSKLTYNLSNFLLDFKN